MVLACLINRNKCTKRKWYNYDTSECMRKLHCANLGRLSKIVHHFKQRSPSIRPYFRFLKCADTQLKLPKKRGGFAICLLIDIVNRNNKQFIISINYGLLNIYVKDIIKAMLRF